MLENEPLARLRLFPGSVADQVIALTDLWKSRSKRTFVAMRERMNELSDLETMVEPAAFDNYFRRSHREKTPEEVVWALIRVMRDDTWLPREQQCTLAEALYLAALKNVSVVTYAQIYQLFPGQEEEFKEICPLGDLIAEKVHQIQSDGADTADIERTTEGVANRENRPYLELTDDKSVPSNPTLPARIHWGTMLLRFVLFAVGASLVIWTVLSAVGVAQP